MTFSPAGSLECRQQPGAASVGSEVPPFAPGLSTSQILKWANLADLMRVSGIGPQFSELLEGAGLDTVKELRTRNAAKMDPTITY